MDEAERRALGALRFNWAPTPDDVWQDAPFHVDGLHQEAVELIMDGFAEAERATESSPLGVALQGEKGAGKTHLLGAIRRRVRERGGYFFLVSLLETSAFWRSTALSILDGFAREDAEKETQLRAFLRRLVDMIEAPRVVRRAVTGDAELTRSTLDAFIDLLRKASPQVGLECQDTARALALRASEQLRDQNIGHAFLCSNDEEEHGDRSGWGLRRGRRSAQEIVRDISHLLALTGPTVIAVDQIDLIVTQSRTSGGRVVRGAEAGWQQTLVLEQIAGGLMSLRETTRRTLSVVACLQNTWDDIRDETTNTVRDRFREANALKQIPNAELGRELVEKRFAQPFREADFVPPYRSWPILPEAFEEAWQFTPRELLRTVDTHVRACLATDEVREMHSLLRTNAEPPVVPAAVTDDVPPSVLADFDAQYAALREAADPAPALDKDAEDAVVPALLRAALTVWVAERGADAERYGVDPLPRGKPALHARLRESLGEESDDEQHWSFRAVSAPHHIAALNRISNATTAAGLTEGVSKRRLFLLRNPPWSQGSRTRQVIAGFEAAGGRTLAFPESDIVQLVALQGLVEKHGYETLRPWFLARRPTTSISFLRDALAGTAIPPEKSTRPAEKPATAVPSIKDAPAAVAPDDPIVLGAGIDRHGRVAIGLEALRRHTAIFAGSGSGKTVFVRRLVEECALRGVSAIVLDPNNDLARLGEPWPVPPSTWDDVEVSRAREYLRTTEVEVWTPLRDGGRPLSLRPLPNFADILDDRDAFEAGVSAAAAALAPRAKVDGATGRAQIGQAVLREALTSYARTGASDLHGFVEYLNALPDGVSRLDDANRLAADMAQLLMAAMVTDPLFGGRGDPVDPALMLTPGTGYRAKVSVISMIGLPDGAARQSFVNQLQMALFAWIKRNPARDRPLRGLLVMDEAQNFAPSGAWTACTQSTLALASQARKYGLGLVFATQAPKGLHNQIPGNAATQLFGLLTSPVQMQAAREIARAKGSDVADIGQLGKGQFYAAIEGSEFEKLQSPLCLTYHPNSPLTEEEVLDRARRQ
ncbi:MAG: DUF87 domain-containing protein [Micromonosporaceae bacterium]|nr:DUF87 domain-containing protein [Micromonosporaceae bacterium]